MQLDRSAHDAPGARWLELQPLQSASVALGDTLHALELTYKPERETIAAKNSAATLSATKSPC